MPRRAPKNPNPETQEHRNKAEMKTRETNYLTCFKMWKLNKPKLNKHIKTYITNKSIKNRRNTSYKRSKLGENHEERLTLHMEHNFIDT